MPNNMLGNSESLREIIQGPIADLLVKLNGENGEKVRVELNKFNRGEPCWVNSNVSNTPNPILHPLSANKTLTIAPCDGTKTLAQAKDVFLSGIDPNFKNWRLDRTGATTGKTRVQVYELAQGAAFAKMFGSLSTDLNKLCLTQHQIRTFCESHSKWLRTYGYATFFLFKENNEFFVAFVDVYSDGLGVHVGRFECDGVWRAENRYRLVCPQLVA